MRRQISVIISILGVLALMAGMIPFTSEVLALDKKDPRVADEAVGVKMPPPGGFPKTVQPERNGHAPVKGKTPNTGGKGLVCYGTGLDGNRVKAMHVIKSGATSHLNTTTLRTAMSDADAWFNSNAQAAGQTRHIRYDHNSSCQPVITSVTLPAGTNMQDDVAIVDTLRGYGYIAEDRKYLLFVDANHPNYCGVGDLWDTDDSDSQSNLNNRGNMYAIVWWGSGQCWTGGNVAHELAHTMGAVQDSAPHSTGEGHCWDRYDLMCYNDGGVWTPTFTCNNEKFDCGRDDYMRTNPTSGSYLDTHWNVADNAFLGT